jgi:Mrp family chromosome partitioning ATPase
VTRTVTVALDGVDGELRDAVAAALAPAGDLTLATPADRDLADVLVVADDAVSSALDRCRSAAQPCVVLLETATVASVSDAMRAGARGAVAREPLDAFGLVGAVRDAAAFRVATAEMAAPGRLVVVTGACGGAGATTVAVALARVAEAPVALLDLDLAGGAVARGAGLAVDMADAGLAGQSSGRRAWERLAVDAGFARVVPAPRRPDLAWLVREGVCAELARAARADAATVIADVGRGAGPAIELVGDASVVVVTARPVADQLAAAAEHAAFVDGLVGGAVPVRVCVSGVRPRDEPVVRLAAAAHGLRIDARLPQLPRDAARAGDRLRALVAVEAA